MMQYIETDFVFSDSSDSLASSAAQILLYSLVRCSVISYGMITCERRAVFVARI